MKRRILFLVVVLALATGGWYIRPRFTKKSTEPSKLVLSGNFEAHEALLSFKVQGRIVDLPIEEGQLVESGALIARLDDSDFRQKINVDDATVGVLESNLALVKAGTRKQDVEAAQ